MPQKQTPPGRGKKEDRRGRRRSSEEEVWDILEFTVREGGCISSVSQGGLEAGKTAVLFFYAGARPPAGVDRRGRRRSGGGFGVGYLVGESFMKRKAESVRFQ